MTMRTRTDSRQQDKRKAALVPPKLYRIGEITRHTGLSRQTIHNYTTMGLIRESERTPGGHRLYDECVFHVLHRIADLKASTPMQKIKQQIVSRHAPPS